MAKTRGSKYYGYEDYQVTRIGYNIFENTTHSCNPYCWWYGKNVFTHYPIDASYINGYNFILEIKENPQALIGASKVYIHPSCTIPRTSLASKYKRCLSAVMADAIIVPGKNLQDVDIWKGTAVFINDTAKKVYLCMFYPDTQTDILLNNVKLGTKLINLVPPISHQNLDNDIREATLEYCGPIARFNSATAFALDYMIGLLPKDKIVFQDTIMKTLGDESNVPTYENMVSIAEMLDSKSDDVVDLGLKTLAALDYAKYPQSVLTVLMHNTTWKYAKAKTSTAVKYMLKKLDCYSGYYVSYNDRYISQADYDLTEKLIRKLNNYDDEKYLSYCYRIPFVYIDEKDVVHPRLKAEE